MIKREKTRKNPKKMAARFARRQRGGGGGGGSEALGRGVGGGSTPHPPPIGDACYICMLILIFSDSIRSIKFC